MCKSWVSLTCMVMCNVPCVTLTYKPAVEEELELFFRERKWFLRGAILLEQRIGWKLVYCEYWAKLFHSLSGKMRTLLLTRISEGGGSCWDRQESETGCRGLFFHEIPCCFGFLLLIPSFSDLGFVRPQWWLNSPAQFKSLFPPGFVSVSQSCVPFFYRNSSYCHCTASAFRQLAHNLPETVE